MARTLHFIVCITVITAGVVISQDDLPPPEVSDECKALGVCEDVPNYPTEQVNKIVAQLEPKTDIVDTRCKNETVPNISQRGGPKEENKVLCESVVRTIYPKAAKESDGTWNYIIQDKSRFVQGFEVELCKNANAECTGAQLVSGYEGRCKQKYVYRSMSVVGNSTSFQKFLQVPSCCACVAQVVN